MAYKLLKTIKNVKKYKNIIFTQNFKENPKITVKITVTIKKVFENIKTTKNTHSLRILRRIQKERLPYNITIIFQLNFYFFIKNIIFYF